MAKKPTLTWTTSTMWCRALSAGLLLWLAACNNQPPSPEPPAVALVQSVEGYPTVVRSQQSYILATTSEIHAGDIISTDSQTRLDLEFTDGSTLALGKNSQLLLHDYARHRRGARLDITLSRGALVAALAQRGPLSLQTPVAGITMIRGTLVITAGEGATNIALLTAGNLTINNSDGHIDIREAGLGTTVPAGAAPGPATPWTEQKTARLAAAIQITRAGDKTHDQQ